MGKYLDNDGLGYFWGKVKAYVQQQIQAIGAITGVKGDAESAYRTGNVNLTPANIGVGAVGLLDSISESDLPSISTSKIYDILPIANGGTGANIVTANHVFAGPDTVNGSPRFRSLAAGDIPNIPASKITSGTLDVARIPSLNYLSTSGGTVSGGNIIAKSTNIKDGTRPSSDTLGNARFLFNGSDNNGLGWVDVINFSSGVQAIRLYARRVISSVTHYAGIILGIDSSGNATVSVQGTNAQEAWRTAIGVGTIGTKNSLAASDIPNHSTSKLTSGTLGIARGGTGSSSVVSIANTSTLTILVWGKLVMVQLHGLELTPGTSTAISSTAYLASYKPGYNVSALVSGPENNNRIARLWVSKDDGKVYINAVNTTTKTAWYGTLVYMLA